jgi:hypothetical protein
MPIIVMVIEKSTSVSWSSLTSSTKCECELRCWTQSSFADVSKLELVFRIYTKLSVNGILTKFRPKSSDARISVTLDGNSALRPCHCRRLLSCTQWDAKMLVIVWKLTGPSHGVYFRFFYWESLSLSFPYSMFRFYMFRCGPSHSALLAVDNWSVADDLMSRRAASSFIWFVF